MTTRWLVLGRDARMKQLAKFLTDEGRTVYYKCTDIWSDDINELTSSYQPQRIVLPIQSLHLDVASLQGIEQATFFVGKLSDSWRALLERRQVHHYLQHESFIWQNAALTAEAMLAHFYKGGQKIQRKRMLITGFGRVAKMLAHLFTRLHAHVIIVVRSHVQLAEAKAYGYEAQLLDETLNIKADYCFNTIPAPWLTSSFHRQLPMPLFDLASVPGCLAGVERADYELLAGLPGRYFAYDAAQLLYDTILQLEGGDVCLKANELV